MPVCHRSKLLYIHIPKNAGKYIENRYNMCDFPWRDANQKQRSLIGLCARLLLKCDSTYQDSRRATLRGMIDLAVVGQHLSLSEIQHLGLLGADVSDYQILVSARNPYTRMLSLYCHLTRQSQWTQSGFEDFCDDWPLVTHFERHGLRAFRKCQSQFVVDINGRIPSNLHIVKVENLEADLIDFELRSGCRSIIAQPSPESVRSSEASREMREAQRPVVNSKVKKSVLRHYQADFAFFGYEP